MAFQDFLIGALVLLIGALFCFVGYRFFRILIAIWGFFAGFNLGTAAMTALFSNAFLQTTTGIVLGLVLGLVFAVLAYFFYYFAVVLLGATAGYDLGSGFIGAIGLNNPGFIAVIVGVVLAVVFAFLILILNLPKLLIMVFTALGGAVAMLAGLLILLGQAKVAYLQYGDAVALVRASWFWSIIAIALAVVGFLVQWRTMQEYTLEWTESSTTQVQ
ncbi:MAG TPA: DUF4203 domain-containing protein [Ktedonobacteraceae bacterium]|nr:DUF4203 domain-containing protein [Ktedonobacteraceae bacterium]